MVESCVGVAFSDSLVLASLLPVSGPCFNGLFEAFLSFSSHLKLFRGELPHFFIIIKQLNQVDSYELFVWVP